MIDLKLKGKSEEKEMERGEGVTKSLETRGDSRGEEGRIAGQEEKERGRERNGEGKKE